MKLSYIIRCLLGILFIYASIDKIRYPDEFLRVVYNYHILPEILINPVVIILPWLELFIGMSLISGILIEGSSFLVGILFISFFLGILINIIRGMNIECGCFNLKENPSAKISMIWYLVRDGFLLIMSIYLMLSIFKNRWR